MKLGTSECNEALRNYPVSNNLEKLMVELLMTPDDDKMLANMTNKICEECTEEEIDILSSIVTRIRNDLGIEDEA